MAENIPDVSAYGIPLIHVNDDLAWGTRSWINEQGNVVYAAAVVFRDESGHLVQGCEKAVGDPKAVSERLVLPDLLKRVLPLLYDPAYRAEVAAQYHRMHRG